MKVKNLLKKFEYYNSIEDMPIWNWFKVQETNDLKYVLKTAFDCEKKEFEMLSNAVKAMTSEYIDSFGLSDSYVEILNLQRSIRLHELDRIIKDDRVHETFAEVKREELKELMKEKNNSDSMDVMVHAKKYMGGNLDMRTTSVKEFYGILRTIKKEIEANKRQQ